MEEERKVRRLEKINQLLVEEVGKIVKKDLDADPAVFLTFTRASTSSDLTHATIFFSTLKDSEEKGTLALLEKNVYTIQYALNRKLRMRPVPKIRFSIDTAAKTEQRLYNILTSHDNSGETQK